MTGPVAVAAASYVTGISDEALIAYAVIGAVVGAGVATYKGRSLIIGIVVGALFGLIGVVVMLLIPGRKTDKFPITYAPSQQPVSYSEQSRPAATARVPLSSGDRWLIGGIIAIVVVGCLFVGWLYLQNQGIAGAVGPSPSPSPTASATKSPTPAPATPAPTPSPTQGFLPPSNASFQELSSREWSKLVKAPDEHVDEAVVVWACIRQFDSATGAGTFRGDAYFENNKNNSWLDADNALFSGDATALSDFVKNDVVKMNAFVLGSQTYDTQIGGSTTVPLFYVSAVEHRGTCK